jgi:hypothetical protein
MNARRTMIALAILVPVAAGLLYAVGVAAPASAITGAGFNPGYIISDPVFFNSASMTQAQIQTFLVNEEGGCTGANNEPCMDDYHTPTPALAATSGGQCGAYPGSAGELASAMIYNVSQACGINPQVLIVTLQKEEGLITAAAPSEGAYHIAMGYGCPDSSACDTNYYGLFNQIYNAAWQFKEYTLFPTHFNFRVGEHAIAYSTNAACGAPVINIQSQATANLYNYTPYQPDAAALANLTGDGDVCSSYGNRNFWVYFSDWFGSPGGNVNPQGVIDSLVPGASSVEISGWAFDPDTTASINVEVSLNGAPASTYPASGSRPDVGAVYGVGPLHGYDITIPVVSSGDQQVCVTALNVGPGTDTGIGCSSVSVIAGASPQGVIDTALAQPAAVEISGWAFDRDTPAPISVSVSVNGNAPVTSLANIARPDVDAAYGGVGPLHGYDVSVPVTSGGPQQVCVTAVNVQGGGNTALGCRTVTVASGSSPFGVVDVVKATPGSIEVAGWIFDRDTTAPINIQVAINGGTPTTALANGSRPDVNAAYGGVGSLHGYDLAIPVAQSGAQRVCVTGVNVGFGSNTTLPCVTVTMPGGAPVLVVDTATGAAGTVSVSGWAFDPDTTASLTVQVSVDGSSTSTVASGSRPDVAAAYPGYGAAHGYSLAIPAAGGVHSVCVTATNVGVGSDTSTCRSLTIPSGSPTGVLDSVLATPGSFTATGWAFDPDTAASIPVQIVVDNGTPTILNANLSRADIAAIYPGYGPFHGYSGSVAASPGLHTVCAYGTNVVGAGTTVLLGCTSAAGMSGSPNGVVDSVAFASGSATVSGWTYDPDTASPISIRVEVDGVAAGTFAAAGSRPDVGAVYPPYGPLHGYIDSVPVAPGTHTICVFGVNTGPGTDSLLGCRSHTF